MDDVMGTTLLEDEKWVLRYEGGGGNRIPLSGPPELLDSLKHGEAEIFNGTYSRDGRAAIVEARVESIKNFGGTTDSSLG